MSKTKRKLPVYSRQVDLNGVWQGWSFKARINPRFGEFLQNVKALQVLEDRLRLVSEAEKPEDPKVQEEHKKEEGQMTLGMMEAMYNLMEPLIVSWNFVDEEGGDLPSNREGLEALPFDLLDLICDKAVEAITQLPLAPSVS